MWGRSGFVGLLALAAVAFTGQAGASPDRAPSSIAELKKRLETILADTHTPALSVAIVRKKGPEWIAGLGKADLASNRPATADTLFRIGSSSKMFASLAILKLVHEGKLSLQDPLHKFAPEIWFENRWEASDPVRLVDVLEHTTGWDDTSLGLFAKDPEQQNLRSLRDQLMADHTSRISRWRPGTRMSYCNSGPAVAAYIIEKITGQRFEDYVAQNFFVPMGMKTATYFRSATASMATLYHLDGREPYPYWNMVFRPSGSISASARDMATVLSFFLNRGVVDGRQIMPTASIERMEVPTRTWAARAGLKIGYGLYNYTTLYDDTGLVYHGHNGGSPGDLTDFAYLPAEGVGYFYSINTSNGAAYYLIGKAIRDYIGVGISSPPMPKAAPLPTNVSAFAGWYEPVTPRNEFNHAVERLTGLSRISFKDGKLHMSSVLGSNQVFVPAAGALWRHESSPMASMALVAPIEGGRFFQGMWYGYTFEHIPAWLVLCEIVLCAFVVLALASVILYAPCWMVSGLWAKHRRPNERWLKIWPLVAVLALIAANLCPVFAGVDALARLGNLTLWSGGLCLGTVVFAMASLAATVSLWRARNVRTSIYGYSIFVVSALLIAVAYLGYWGLIGIRTWV